MEHYGAPARRGFIIPELPDLALYDAVFDAFHRLVDKIKATRITTIAMRHTFSYVLFLLRISPDQDAACYEQDQSQ